MSVSFPDAPGVPGHSGGMRRNDHEAKGGGDAFDVGPLGWVKGEIENAMQGAVAALAQFAAAPADESIKAAQKQLHQAHGALQMVGLDGVTRLSEELEGLLADLEKQTAPRSPDNFAAAEQAFRAILAYLDRLMAGDAHQPLRLFEPYRAVLAARGRSQQAEPADLYFPDLTPLSLPLLQNPADGRAAAAAPDQAAAPVAEQTAAATRQPDALYYREQRGRYQRALLKWLKKDSAGIDDMRAVVAGLRAFPGAGPQRPFWWVAEAFFEALAAGALPPDIDARRLSNRIEQQLKRLVEGSQNVAERLMREALYAVARAAPASELIGQVKAAYRLAGTIPPDQSGAAVVASVHPALRPLQEKVARLKEDWNLYAAGNVAGLSAYREGVAALRAQMDELRDELRDEPRDKPGGQPGSEALDALARALAATGAWLHSHRDKMSEAVALEVATALLLLERTLGALPGPTEDLPRQAELVCARLEACIEGRLLRTAPDIPLLDRMARQAQERLVLSQVIGDMQASLRTVEQVLDGFFRQPSKRAELTRIEQPMQQLLGALDMLGERRAHHALATTAGAIGRFAAVDYVPRQEHFEVIAQTLSGLGVYIQSLAGGNTDFDAAMTPVTAAAAGPNFEETQLVPTVEAQLAAQQREAERLFEEWKQRPDDRTVRFELQKNLQAIQADAGLVADAGLASRATEALDLLQRADALFDQTGTHQPAPPQQDAAAAGLPLERNIAAAIDGLARGAAAPPPSAEVVAMLEANDETVDAGLIAIYLEEAELVLAGIDENVALARTRPEDAQVLATLRRSFHTLKGSGRMVGLTRLGEAAWAVEQTINMWLEQQRGASDGLLRLISMAHAYFADAVAQLRQTGQSPDEQALVQFAEDLRHGTLASEAPDAAQPSGAEALVGAPGPGAAPVVKATIPDATAPFAATALPQTGVPPIPASQPQADRPAAVLSPGEPQAADAPAVLDTDDEGFDFAALEPDEPDAPRRLAASGAIVIGGREISATLFELFAGEARVHLSVMKQQYEMLQQHGIVTDALMRAAHTLGGIAGTVQIEPLRALGHGFERALQQLSTSELSESEQELVREALEAIEAMVDEAIAQRMPELRVDLAARLEQAAMPAQPEPEWLPEEEGGLERGAGEASGPQLAAAIAAEEDHVPEPSRVEAPPAAPGASVAAAPARAMLAAADAAERRRRRIDDDLDAQVLPVFLEEAHELIPLIGATLRDWRGGAVDGGIDGADNAPGTALLRLLHTLKGSARMAGAMSMGELTHHVEARLEHALALRSIPASLFDDLETSVDRMGTLYERLSRPGAAEANAARRAAARAAAPAPQPADPGGAAGAAPALPGTATSGRGGEPPAAEPAAEPQRVPMLRVRADAIDKLVNQAGEVAIARSRIEGEMRSLKGAMQELTDNVQRLRAQLREIEIQAESQMQSHRHQAEAVREQFDPLEFDRFTRFQEVTRLMAESVNDVHTVQQNLLSAVNETDAALLAQARLNRDLQHDLMKVRMVPFGSLAERLYRIVRQSAKALGKRVNLEIRGNQVELDRSVLERITAPLEHLLRNAVSHGLEMPEQRLAQGKPPFGEIRLDLAQEGNEVQLTLADDGAGIDIGRVRARAIALGLMGEDETPGEGAIADFIFHPGFSTAGEVTQLAGRGIGMDVVKSEIAGLGGRVELRSSRGRGLRIVIHLPLTLAVTHAVLVRAGTRLVAIPAVMVAQVQQVRAAELARAYASNHAEWQNRRYDLHYLPHLLGDPGAVAKERRFSPLLLLRSGANAIALHVDEIVGSNQEIVVKAIGPQLARLPGISGATVLGSGDIVLIVNPVLLAERAEHRRAVAAASAPASPGAPPPPAAAAAPAQRTVMVVDDSLTVRKITGRLLTREGYQVVVAKDGVDAMEKLQETLPDIMLVDIEMPRMDGFDLTRTVRADARLAATPIIMISSRTADKHRNYARDIGADAFLGKPYQEERLLEQVAALIASGRTHQEQRTTPDANAIVAAGIDASIAGDPPLPAATS